MEGGHKQSLGGGTASGGCRKFWWGGILSTNPQKLDVFTEIESDFSVGIGNSNVFSAQNQVVSKKKKKVFTEIESDFSAETVSFTLVGGMHPEMEPNFLK